MEEGIGNALSGFYSSIADGIPSTIGAVIILIIGIVIAKIVKGLIVKVINKSGLDDKLSTKKLKLSEFIGKLVYIILMIFVFTLTLGKLGMTDVLDPVKDLLDGFGAFIPNIVGAGLVAYIGYMLATIVSELVGLSGDTIQKFVPKLKLPENINLVSILQKVVFIFIFIPLLISAFEILNMDAISEPATGMLNSFFEAIPRILVAALILVVFVVGGKMLSEIIKDLLNSMNINNILSKAGLASITGETNMVSVIGNLVYAFIVIFGITTALEKLEFESLTVILNIVLAYGAKILFGLVILAIGNWISTLAATNFSKNEDNSFVASIIRVAVLAIFLAIGLKTMGIADDIINLAFGITLGTVALTIVLSFGLGGREAAGKQMGKILDKFNK